MDSDTIYKIYVIFMLSMTAGVSFLITTGVLYSPIDFGMGPEMELKGEGCPCENYGEDLPACNFSFIFDRSGDPLLKSVLNKNTSVILDGSSVCIPHYLVNISSQGFRDKYYEEEKGDNTFRILIVGDSVTFGQGVNISDTFQALLEEKLNRGEDNRSFDVINLGVPGFNAVEKAEFLEVEGLMYDPDAIIFQHNGDDVVNKTELFNLIDIEKKEILEELKSENSSERDISKNKINAEAAIRGHERYFERLSRESFDEKWRRIESAFEKVNSIFNEDIDIYVFTFHASKREIEDLKNLTEFYDWNYVGIGSELNKWKNKYGEDKIEVLPGKDSHPTSFTHKLIADKLYSALMS